MPYSKNDGEIINEYQKGDKGVFKILINKYSPSIFNFTAHLVGKDNAEDIVQEVFIKVWKKIDDFDLKKSSFKTWIFTIAKNTSTDFLRKKRPYSFSSLDKPDEESTFEESIVDEEILPDETLAKIQDNEFLKVLLQTLSIEHRTILTLHYQEEMTFQEIGEILNKPLNTIKSYHLRALKKLRNKISK